MRLLALLSALVLALALAGCGGDDDADDDAAAPPPAETEEPPAGDGEASPQGREIFIGSCGGCHVLDDAGTSGTVGPPLDGHDLSQDDIETQVREGGGGMPAFEGTLSDEEIQEVSAYVAAQGGG
jgi:mono/diheme cytochrome c family protein